MPSEALARTDRATRNFRRPLTGIVIFPKQERKPDPVVDEVLRPRGIREQAFDAVGRLLQYDKRITDLRQSQEAHAAAIGKRLGLAEGNAIVASNNAKTVLGMVRRLEESTIPKLRAEVSMHGNVLADLSQEVRQGYADLDEQIHGLRVNSVDQADVDALAGQVQAQRGSIKLVDLKSDHCQQQVFALFGRICNIEQALAPRPTAKSGFDWKLQGAWIGLITGAAILAARFFNLL